MLPPKKSPMEESAGKLLASVRGMSGKMPMADEAEPQEEAGQGAESAEEALDSAVKNAMAAGMSGDEIHAYVDQCMKGAEAE